jgi:hypothetical protein
MPSREWQLRIQDILESIDKILRWTLDYGLSGQYDISPRVPNPKRAENLRRTANFPILGKEKYRDNVPRNWAGSLPVIYADFPIAGLPG